MNEELASGAKKLRSLVAQEEGKLWYSQHSNQAHWPGEKSGSVVDIAHEGDIHYGTVLLLEGADFDILVPDEERKMHRLPKYERDTTFREKLFMIPASIALYVVDWGSGDPLRNILRKIPLTRTLR